MSNKEPFTITLFDAISGEMTTRELSAEEIAQLPEAKDETPSPD